MIEEGYSQEEITKELNDVVDEEIQRLDNEREDPERQNERELQEAEKQKEEAESNKNTIMLKSSEKLNLN